MESIIDDLASVAQSRYPMFPVKLMMRDQYNSAEYAPQVTAPTLIILAANDQVVPAYSTDNLIEQFNPNTVHTAIIENATHYNIQNYTRYLRWTTWLDSVNKSLIYSKAGVNPPAFFV